jgi:UrcA family protein
MNPPVTIAMILCGIVGTAGMAAASAATQDEAVPSLVVKYRADSLLTDRGAHVVYRKIVNAAEEVCPAAPGSRLLSESVRQCRAQSIARAVMQINNSRLAAIHDSVSRSG